ncbi:hypothetical protein FE840_009055 [Peteryoungia desertarenae]|uniref:Uncharacterized protein n=1 Tax=Peteryoungia desertarenae TaxID=1813451 RepID=A0ABX6QMB5_9HYPH|nr:hypothetical protein [Peteryoungia desertarenae]QLF69680.1 hypothetical protein FE840_009055 [Peteryoungia desertarenae]
MTGTEETKLLTLIEALFNGQKRTLGMVEAAIEKFSTVETEITKLNRKMNSLQELATRQHAETSTRLEAIISRLDETELVLDERSRDIKRTQIDVVGQYNEVLTALQDASQAFRVAQDLESRLTVIETKLAHG